MTSLSEISHNVSNLSNPDIQTQEFRTSFLIPIENMAKLDSKLVLLSKKATKMGLAPPTKSVDGPFDFYTIERHKWYLCPVHGEMDVRCCEQTVLKLWKPEGLVQFFMVEIKGESPVFNGWHLAGAIDALTAEDGEAVMFIRPAPGEEIPVRYREASSYACEHCGAVRNRKETFIIKHEDGKVISVGRQCIKDFLGHISPQELAAFYEDIHSFIGFEGWGRGELFVPLADFIQATTTIMNEYGWVSRKMAKDTGDISTANRVWGWAFAKATDEVVKKLGGFPKSDGKLADEIEQWLETQQDREGSDFIHNLKVLWKMNRVVSKTMGVAAAAYNSYNGWKLRENQKKDLLPKEERQFVGEVGKRDIFEVTLLAEPTQYEGSFGVTHCYRLAVNGGHSAVWFSTSGCGLKIGIPVKVKATVKSHKDDPKYGKSTMFSRMDLYVEKVKVKVDKSEVQIQRYQNNVAWKFKSDADFKFNRAFNCQTEYEADLVECSLIVNKGKVFQIVDRIAHLVEEAEHHSHGYRYANPGLDEWTVKVYNIDGSVHFQRKNGKPFTKIQVEEFIIDFREKNEKLMLKAMNFFNEKYGSKEYKATIQIQNPSQFETVEHFNKWQVYMDVLRLGGGANELTDYVVVGEFDSKEAALSFVEKLAVENGKEGAHCVGSRIVVKAVKKYGVRNIRLTEDHFSNWHSGTWYRVHWDSVNFDGSVDTRSFSSKNDKNFRDKIAELVPIRGW